MALNIFGRRREQIREQARSVRPGDLAVRNAQVLEMARPWLRWVFTGSGAVLAVCTGALAFGTPEGEAAGNIRSGAGSIIVGLVTLGVIHLLFRGSDRSERRAVALGGDGPGAGEPSAGASATHESETGEAEGGGSSDDAGEAGAKNGDPEEADAEDGNDAVPPAIPRDPAVQRAMERAVFMVQLGYRLVMFVGLCLVAGVIFSFRGVFGI